MTSKSEKRNDSEAGLAMYRMPRPQRVLVIAPHPDDEAVGCGGFLVHATRNGARVDLVLVTDGDRHPSGHPDATLAETRRRESERACRSLGIHRVHRWHLTDGSLAPDQLPGSKLDSLVRDLAIELVLVPHPQEAHADHAAVAVMPSQLRRADDNLSVMTYEVWTPISRPQCVVDITSAWETKLAAIRTYASQCRRFNLETLAGGLGQYRAAWSRMQGWRYAECFGRFSLAEYREFCRAN